MNRKTILTLGSSALISLGLLGGAATIASANQNAANDMAEAQAFLAAPGSLNDAVIAAETKTGGKAMSASFESDEANAGMYEVEIVMPDGTMMAAVVNPADGSATAMSAMDDDENGEGDDDDDDNESN
ncbi:MAG: hypothetical protein WBN04_12135 [Paracoccaceae bacterium]